MIVATAALRSRTARKRNLRTRAAVTPPTLDPLLDVFPLVDRFREHRASQVRQLVIGTEAEGDELRRRELGDTALQIVRKNAPEAQRLLQADDTVLNRHDHGSCRERQERQTESQHDVPPGHPRAWVPPEEGQTDEYIQRQDGEGDVVEDRVVAAMGRVAL